MLILLELTCRSATARAPLMGLLGPRVGRSLPLDSALARWVRWRPLEIIEMELWRGGDARYGEESPETLGLAIGLELGLAPRWSDELRRGEPT